jgi:invasion protein IalB
MSARIPLFLAAVLALAPAFSVPAFAQQGAKKTAAKSDAKSGVPGGATLVKSFGDWGAYTAQTGRSKMCYALSEPKSRTPASIKDTKAYLFVSFRPTERVSNELATVLNFKTKEKGPGSLVVGEASYDLITMGENAWIKTPSDEMAAINAMMKGSSLTLQAVSARGNKTSDRYSLMGFSQALDQAKRDCQ